MERHDSHHLSPPDGFAEPSLGPPCELGVRSAYDTSHIGHEVGEESRVEGLPEWIDAELVENVIATGFFGGRSEIRTLEDDGLFCPTLHREGPRGDSLTGRRELPSPRAGNELTLYRWESLSIPSVHVLMLAVERLVLREGESRVESHAHVGNCWCSASSSRRDWVSSTRSVSSWMESGRAEFGRAVESVRTGVVRRGETRRKRASIGVGVVQREEPGSKRVRRRLNPGRQLRFYSYFRPSLTAAWVAMRCFRGGGGLKENENEIRGGI